MQVLASLVALFLAQVAVSTPLEKRAVAYYAPSANGGSQLDLAAAPLGEPMNVRVLSSLVGSLMLTYWDCRSSSPALARPRFSLTRGS